MAGLLIGLGFLVRDHLKLANENNLMGRELYGVYKQIDDGRFNTRIIQTIDRVVTKTVYIPPEGHVTITPIDPTKKLEDVVIIKYTTFGFTFEPGFQFSVAPLGGGMDAKVIYWNRLGLALGVGYFQHLNGSDSVSPTGSLTYRLDRIPLVHNTELSIGVMPIPTLSGFMGLRWGL